MAIKEELNGLYKIYNSRNGTSYKNNKWLILGLHDKHRTVLGVADELGFDSYVIKKLLKNYGVETGRFTRSMRIQKLVDQHGGGDPKEFFENKYKECPSCAKLGKSLGVSRTTVFKALRHLGIKMNNQGGPNNKGSRIRDRVYDVMGAGQGVNIQGLADELECSRESVSKYKWEYIRGREELDG